MITRSPALVAAVAGVAVAAAATASPGIRLSLVSRPVQPVVGHPVSIVVRVARGGKPVAHAKVAVWIARGHARSSFAARPAAGGRYRARVVFPAAGRWTFGARAGRARVAFGSVLVRRPPVPLSFAWPTSVDVESNRSLLLVENGNGRVLHIDPRTGKIVVVAQTDRAYAVDHGASGATYVSAAGRLLRLQDGKLTLVVNTGEDTGPLAVAPNGDVYYSTAARIFRVAGGTGTPVRIAGTGVEGYSGDGGPATAAQISGPHGLALTGDGGLLVSDTGNGRVRRIDLSTGLIETWAVLGSPRGIDVGSDESVYVADGSTRRIVRLMIDGRRLGTVGRKFGDPYDVEAAPDGSLYVVDTAAAGSLYRVAPGGTSTVVSRRG
jgi:sugar lactone lactonase YvrE